MNKNELINRTMKSISGLNQVGHRISPLQLQAIQAYLLHSWRVSGDTGMWQSKKYVLEHQAFDKLPRRTVQAIDELIPATTRGEMRLEFGKGYSSKILVDAGLSLYLQDRLNKVREKMERMRRKGAPVPTKVGIGFGLPRRPY